MQVFHYHLAAKRGTVVPLPLLQEVRMGDARKGPYPRAVELIGLDATEKLYENGLTVIEEDLFWRFMDDAEDLNRISEIVKARTPTPRDRPGKVLCPAGHPTDPEASRECAPVGQFPQGTGDPLGVSIQP